MKKIILQELIRRCQICGDLHDLGFQTIHIATALSVSRNLVSQYLNEYVQEGVVIKVTGRPVLFYAKCVLEERYQCHLEKTNYDTIDELMVCLLVKKKMQDFDYLIGAEGSLHSAVEQCKAAISYPPHGLPLLLYGPTGSGKSYMANLTYDYAINNKIIDKDKRFVVVNCSEYANNPELLTANLFGSRKGAYTGAEKDNPGLLSIADGGVLFLDEVHCLKAACQEKLFLYMDKGIYHMLGDNETWYTSKVRIVFATTENPEQALLKTLLRRIPIIVTISSLQERPMKEKKQLMYSVFKQETQHIQKKIRISNLVHDTILDGDFMGNIGSMKNLIKAACANAFLQDSTKSEYLDIHVYHLPYQLLQQFPIISVKQSGEHDVEMIDIDRIEPKQKRTSMLLHMYQSILAHYFKWKKEGVLHSEQCIEDLMEDVNNYHDYITFDKKLKNNPGLDFTRKMVDKIFSIVINRYGIKINNNNILSYARYMHEYTKESAGIRSWIQSHEEDIQDFVNFLEQQLYRENYIAREIVENMKLNLDIELDSMSRMSMMLSLKSYNRDMDLDHTICIILAHGYSTASSIADAVNRLLGQYIFDAIDMQLDVSVDKITEQLNDFLKLRNAYDELILLVDMGSLEEIYKGIKHVKCNIGIINNVTTRVALKIGEGIKQKKPMEQVLRQTAQEYFRSTYINNRKRKNAILSVCATGVGAAEKIMDLLRTSLPHDIELDIVAYDFRKLAEHGHDDIVFQKYNIDTIIGTLNPEVEGIPFIAVEDIVLNTNLSVLENVFSKYLDAKGIVEFNQNILKNFTLDNLLNHLTILNANKLLEDVEEVVRNVEKDLNVVLDAASKIGLYVHMCCMVELLIMKKELDVYEDLDIFEREHQEFLRCMKTHAIHIEQHYSIEISSTEIAYMYNYFL